MGKLRVERVRGSTWWGRGRESLRKGNQSGEEAEGGEG